MCVLLLPRSGKYLLTESGLLEFEIQLKEYDWNPEYKFFWQRIRNPVPGIQDSPPWQERSVTSGVPQD